MTTKHAPTPYEARQSMRGGYWFIDYKQGGEGFTLAKDLDEATAQFIVRACNTHDEAREALKALADACEDEDQWPTLVENARAVLAKMEPTP